MRISDRILFDGVRANLQHNLEQVARVGEELASGRRLHAPSDDPVATAQALRHRRDLALNQQYLRGVDAARARLSAVDRALGGLTDTLQRARELALQAGSGVLGADQMQAIGVELNQLVQHAIQLGNTSFAGQFLFAGTKTTTPPFAPTGDPNTPASVTYMGNAVAIRQDLGQGVQVRVDVPGDQAVQPAIQALIQLRDAVTAGDGVTATGPALSALDGALDTVLQVRGSVGARVNRLDAIGNQLTEEQTSLEGLRSGLEDIDVADTVVRLNAARNVYEAALGAAARAIQPSLLEFLR